MSVGCPARILRVLRSEAAFSWQGAATPAAVCHRSWSHQAMACEMQLCDQAAAVLTAVVHMAVAMAPGAPEHCHACLLVWDLQRQ
jgi:hypothetical protein